MELQTEGASAGELVTTDWTWLRAEGGPIAARVDRPGDGQPLRGSLVIVPPIVRERVSAFRTLRYLSLVAARSGLASVVIDLPGDGDSPRWGGLSLEADWRSAVRSAEELARRLAPDAPHHQVGLRIGACLLSEPRADTREVRILWQPVTGRSFVRQQRNARRWGIAVEPVAEGVEFPGGHFREEDVASMAALSFPKRPPHGSGLQIRNEADPGVAARIAVCPPPAARIPFDSIHEIVRTLPQSVASRAPEWHPTATAAVASGVMETLAPVGKHRLRSVLTHPTGYVNPHAAVAFTAMGSELASGPADLWVTLSRAMASKGVVSLRADRRGLGEALFPTEPGEAPCYTDDAVLDTVDLLAALQTRAPGVPTVGVGACAGAWCFLRAAAVTPLDRVIAVSLVHWSPDASIYDAQFYDRYHAEGRNPVPFPGPDEARHATLRSARQSGWRAARRLWTMWGETYRGDRIGRMVNYVRPDTEIDVLLGPADNRRFLLKGGRWQLLRHRLRLTTVDCLDHSLLSERGRRVVAQHVLDSVGAADMARPLALAS